MSSDVTVRSRIGVSLPMLNQPYEAYPELARLADEAGFDSLWDYEFFRNPFITHGLCSQTTSNIRLCTGIATASSRSPFEMANAAADVDELSGGRMVLGLSTGGAAWTDLFNGAEVSHPLPRMREYIESLRLLWKHFGDGEPVSYEGRYVRFTTPPFNPWGLRQLARPQIPVYLACLKPKMLQLAGEIADGVLGYLNTPRFIEEQVTPNIAAGAAKAGRDPSEVDITSLVLCSVSEDRDEAMRLARINVGMYVAYPVSATVVEFMGLEEERDAVVQALVAGGPPALEAATSDELVRTFAIAGTPDEAAEQLAAFEGTLPHIVLHTPYVPPITGAESERAFRSMVAAFARERAA